MRKTIAFLLTIFIAIIIPLSAFAQDKPVASLGANLTKDQRQEMLDLFHANESDTRIIEVTNQEERTYLEGLVSEDKIGTRAISSAYVEILDEGKGIQVETHNINWVTKEMYANAMVTAGLENARAIAAAPFQVSGTAALTGIIKAFEEATGENLSEEAKKAANEELVTTGKLGEDIGQDKAASLIKEIKERIIKENITDPQQIRNIIIQIAGDLNINITQEQIDQLVGLMERISKLDLNVEKISGQLANISKGLDKVRETIDQNKGLLQQILDAIKNFFAWLADLFKK
jgi:uncharacterized protein YpuA (DUF1002 family)